ncbi:MAG: hypothetical protein A2413_17380 [Treponema sp. RIFOXYC1_FULL_61_9]|nr:MAG: hypothetical protein A2413_17380 [Treponema sp. RIFOXYC1_FULL_61_9]
MWLKKEISRGGGYFVSAAAAVKLPTGALSGYEIVSSGYPDFALGLLADFHSDGPFSWYAQAGATIPGEVVLPSSAEPYPFAVALLAAEFRPRSPWSLVGQLNFKTRVISGSLAHGFFTEIDRLSLPQTDLVFGLVRSGERDRLQLFFTENFLTHQGADITVGVRYSRVFPLRP